MAKSTRSSDSYAGLKIVDIAKIRPNPAVNNITVSLVIANGYALKNINIELVSLTGEVLLSNDISALAGVAMPNGTTDVQLDVRSLPQGVYIVHARSLAGTDSEMLVIVR